jgi:hypothetical protein
MPETKDPKGDGLDTLSPADFPIGSPESRAAARLQLRRCEHALTYYVESGPDWKPTECNPIGAKITGGGLPDLSYLRREGETVNAFKRRVFADLPAGGPMRFVHMIPDDTPPRQLAEDWASHVATGDMS